MSSSNYWLLWYKKFEWMTGGGGFIITNFLFFAKKFLNEKSLFLIYKLVWISLPYSARLENSKTWVEYRQDQHGHFIQSSGYFIPSFYWWRGHIFKAPPELRSMEMSI